MKRIVIIGVLAVFLVLLIVLISLKFDLFYRMPKCEAFTFEGKTLGCDYVMLGKNKTNVTKIAVTEGMFRKNNKLYLKTFRIGTNGRRIREDVIVGNLDDSDKLIVYVKQKVTDLYPMSADMIYEKYHITDFETKYSQDNLKGKVVVLKLDISSEDDYLYLSQIHVINK